MKKAIAYTASNELHWKGDSVTMDAAMSLKKNSQEDFVCPICANYMFPPIWKCKNGHSHCKDCFIRLPDCPQCLGHRIKSRKYTVEKIGSISYFPCKYRSDGCLTSAKESVIVDHVRYCDYAKKNCPFMETENCCWRGRKKDFIDHTQEYHGQHVYFENKKKMMVEGINDIDRLKNYNCMFVVFGEIFRFSWEMNDKTDIMRFAAYNIKRPVDEYWYKISFLNGINNNEAISLTGPCLYSDIDLGTFVCGFYLMTKYDMLKNICDSYGDVRYTVEIYKKNEAQVGV